MASISETGHLKNVTHFQNLIDAVTTFGAAYVPANEALTLPKLNAKKDAAELALLKTKEFEIPLITARGARRMAFDPLRQTATRIVATLEASGASKAARKAAESINRKIQGKRAPGSPKPDSSQPENNPTAGNEPENPENQNTPKTISASQQSYDRQADYLQELILLLQSEPTYNPNEPELKIDALIMFQQTLIDANKSVSTAFYPFSNAIISRDKIFYEPETGLLDTAYDVKAYVKALFGHTSPQYILVRSIEFRKR